MPDEQSETTRRNVLQAIGGAGAASVGTAAFSTNAAAEGTDNRRRFLETDLRGGAKLQILQKAFSEQQTRELFDVAFENGFQPKWSDVETWSLTDTDEDRRAENLLVKFETDAPNEQSMLLWSDSDELDPELTRIKSRAEGVDELTVSTVNEGAGISQETFTLTPSDRRDLAEQFGQDTTDVQQPDCDEDNDGDTDDSVGVTVPPSQQADCHNGSGAPGVSTDPNPDSGGGGGIDNPCDNYDCMIRTGVNTGVAATSCGGAAAATPAGYSSVIGSAATTAMWEGCRRAFTKELNNKCQFCSLR